MLESDNLEIVFQKAVDFLLNQQTEDGGFVSLSSASPDFSKALKFHSVFSTTLILQNLTKIPETGRVKLIKGKAAQFLLYQKSPYWTWNYWQRNSPQAKEMPYPDDLDDTFCALTALYLYNQKLITGKSLASATQILTSLEIREGGPYKTWLVKEDAPPIWKDVDLGVNANIAYFLHLQNVDLPNLNSFFQNAIKKKYFISPYYPTPYPIIYFLSRFIKGKSRSTLHKKIINSQTNNLLYIALLVSSLINLGYSSNKNTDQLVQKLISSQKANGSWDASTFYTGVNPKRNKKFFAGSPSLTTAFVLEALSLYTISKKNQEVKKDNTKNPDKKGVRIYKGVISKIEKRFGGLGENIKLESIKYLHQVLKNDKDNQITLLPFLFYRSLQTTTKESDHNKISDTTLIDLGAASVYGWIAYTIYDNFLDEEAKTSSLPIANLCLRELTTIFNSVLPTNTEFPKVFQKIMDGLEEANTWEVNNCRFSPNTGIKNIHIPNYKDLSFLAERSMGHSLGCLAILMSFNFKENSPEIKNLLLFFKHFLIARQLNDDAHDWEDDLKKGQINSVGAILLSQRKNSQNLKELFWNRTIEDVCSLIELHAKEAKLYLSKIAVIKNKQILLQLVEKQEKSTLIARREKANTLLFAKSYKEFI